MCDTNDRTPVLPAPEAIAGVLLDAAGEGAGAPAVPNQGFTPERRDPVPPTLGAVAAEPPFARHLMLERLAGEHFDVLVVGGGITGVGVALDVASPGLSAALVEADDLASGTP